MTLTQLSLFYIHYSIIILKSQQFLFFYLEFGNVSHFVYASTAMESLQSWSIAMKDQLEVDPRKDGFFRSCVVNCRVPDPKALVMVESSGDKVESSEDNVEKYSVRKKVRLKTYDQRLTLLLSVVEQAERLEVIDRLIFVRINIDVMLSTYDYVVAEDIESFIAAKCTLLIVKSCDSGGGVIGKPLVVVVRHRISRGKCFN